jgi:hypothetical protein
MASSSDYNSGSGRGPSSASSSRGRSGGNYNKSDAPTFDHQPRPSTAKGGRPQQSYQNRNQHQQPHHEEQDDGEKSSVGLQMNLPGDRDQGKSGVAVIRATRKTNQPQHQLPPRLAQQQQQQQKQKQSLTQKTHHFVDDHNDKNCIVCYKEVKYYSVGACDHSVCYECSGRMRVLMEQNECPICRKSLDFVSHHFMINTSILLKKM